jgi:hypothetical protein
VNSRLTESKYVEGKSKLSVAKFYIALCDSFVIWLRPFILGSVSGAQDLNEFSSHTLILSFLTD